MNLWQALRFPPNVRLSIIGGGGKTSILFELARLSREHSPIVTTTTRMFFPQERDLERVEGLQLPLPGGPCFIYASSLPEGKVAGLGVEQLDEVATRSLNRPILCEADGSRRCPLKVHAEHEPVIASCTTHLMVVVGLSAWGQEITPANCHRAELWRGGSRLGVSEAVTLIERMLGRCPTLPTWVVLNQARLPYQRAAARQIAKQLGVPSLWREHETWGLLEPANTKKPGSQVLPDELPG